MLGCHTAQTPVPLWSVSGKDPTHSPHKSSPGWILFTFSSGSYHWVLGARAHRRQPRARAGQPECSNLLRKRAAHASAALLPQVQPCAGADAFKSLEGSWWSVRIYSLRAETCADCCLRTRTCSVCQQLCLKSDSCDHPKGLAQLNGSCASRAEIHSQPPACITGEAQIIATMPGGMALAGRTAAGPTGELSWSCLPLTALRPGDRDWKKGLLPLVS